MQREIYYGVSLVKNQYSTTKEEGVAMHQHDDELLLLLLSFFNKSRSPPGSYKERVQRTVYGIVLYNWKMMPSCTCQISVKTLSFNNFILLIRITNRNNHSARTIAPLNKQRCSWVNSILRRYNHYRMKLLKAIKLIIMTIIIIIAMLYSLIFPLSSRSIQAVITVDDRKVCTLNISQLTLRIRPIFSSLFANLQFAASATSTQSLSVLKCKLNYESMQITLPFLRVHNPQSQATVLVDLGSLWTILKADILKRTSQPQKVMPLFSSVQISIQSMTISDLVGEFPASLYVLLKEYQQLQHHNDEGFLLSSWNLQHLQLRIDELILFSENELVSTVNGLDFAISEFEVAGSDDKEFESQLTVHVTSTSIYQYSAPSMLSMVYCPSSSQFVSSPSPSPIFQIVSLHQEISWHLSHYDSQAKKQRQHQRQRQLLRCQWSGSIANVSIYDHAALSSFWQQTNSMISMAWGLVRRPTSVGLMQSIKKENSEDKQKCLVNTMQQEIQSFEFHH